MQVKRRDFNKPSKKRERENKKKKDNINKKNIIK